MRNWRAAASGSARIRSSSPFSSAPVSISTESMGITPPRGVCLDRDGGIILEQPMTRTLSGWSRLYRALLDALPARTYRFGKRLDADRAGRGRRHRDVCRRHERARRPPGRRRRRPLHGARAIPARREPVYAGYVAWRAVLDEADVPPALWREVVELYAFCLPDGEQLISYAVPGRDNDTAVGRRAYNIIWYRPTDARHARRYLDRRRGPHPCRRHPAAAHPTRGHRADQSRRQTPHRAADRRHSSSAPRRSFSRSTILIRRAWCSAAWRSPAMPPSSPGRMPAPAPPRRRSMRPASPTASRDAGGDLAAGLERYERMQLPFGEAMVALNRDEGAYLSAQIKPKAERTRRGTAPRPRRGAARPHRAQRPDGRHRRQPRPDRALLSELRTVAIGSLRQGRICIGHPRLAAKMRDTNRASSTCHGPQRRAIQYTPPHPVITGSSAFADDDSKRSPHEADAPTYSLRAKNDRLHLRKTTARRASVRRLGRLTNDNEPQWRAGRL